MAHPPPSNNVTFGILSAIASGSQAITRRGKPRQRSAIACEWCHQRRVKCTATVSGIPCELCARSSRECRLIQSKRLGKRKASVSGDVFRSDHQSGSEHNHKVKATWQLEDDTTPQSEDALVASRALAELQQATSNVSRDASPSLEDADTLYAQVLDDSNEHGDRDEDDEEDSVHQQRNEHSYSSHPQSQARETSRQVVYLGETFNLTHLIHSTQPGARSHRHHLSLPIRSSHARKAPTANVQDAETLELLKHQGAFLLPSVDVMLDLFTVYFTYVHPHYPILSRSDFADKYRRPSAPPSYLLLQSVLFTAVGHCDSALLRRLGLGSRYDARLKLFKRASALYNADHEIDKLTLVQSLFLMSFWWNKPTDQKDTWHWLGISISLAVTIGMHRDTTDSVLSVEDQRLWKRIWWTLFTEDKHAAAALGRPVHIRLNDCDVKPLEMSDMLEEPLSISNGDQAVFGRQTRQHALYVIAFSDLSKIVERIIDASFNAYDQSTTDKRATLQMCERSLGQWAAQLPAELSIERGGLWPNSLHIAHK
jgi:hypothetical protein